MIYLFPKLSKYDLFFVRLIGGGLGNLLFPWARAVCIGKKFDLPLIYPAWPQIKVGPYLRREKDKRHYIRLFKPTADYIHGMTKFQLLIRLPRIQEANFISNPGYFLSQRKDQIVTISGVPDFFLNRLGDEIDTASKAPDLFGSIATDYRLIKHNLLSIVRPEHLPKLNGRSFFAAHIRLGDFKIGQQTTPLDFFDNCLSQIKRKFPHIEIMIFTDGTKREVAPLLEKHQASLADFGSSLADLLAMSSAKLLVASKNSTFSWWASCLGRMSVIWPKDTTNAPIYSDKLGQEVFIENSGAISDKFLCRLHETTDENRLD